MFAMSCSHLNDLACGMARATHKKGVSAFPTGGSMRTKASWKPVGHSAKKWKESSQHRGSLGMIQETKPPRKRRNGEKPPWK